MPARNPFALLGDDAAEANQTALTKKAAPKKAAAPKKPAAAAPKKAAAAPKKAAAAPKKAAAAAPKKAAAAAGPKKADKPAPKKAAAPAEEPVRGSRVPREALDTKRGAPRSERKPDDHKRQQDPNRRPPKREFDRQDGTGRAHEGPKKGGAGRGNWGKPGDAREAEAEMGQDRPERKERGEKRERRERREREPREHRAEKREERELTEEEKALAELRKRQMTLQQFTSKQQAKEKLVLESAPSVEIACSVNEADYQPLHPEAEAEKPKEEGKKDEGKEKQQKEKPKKAKKEELKFNFEFSDDRRPERQRRTPVEKPHKLSTKDETAFPSLA